VKFLRENASFLAVGFLLTFCSSFGQTFFISLFSGDIRAEFNLSHGAWGGIYMIATLGSAAMMVWSGGLTDTVRVRTLSAIIFIGFITACIAMASITATWMLFPIIFALRQCGQGMFSHISGVAISRWFDATRGKALAISGLGYSLGEAILPLIFVGLMAWIGWRGSWLVAAAVLFAIAPILLYLLRQERTPQSQAETSQSIGLDNRHWTRAQVMRLPFFFLIIPLLTAPSTFGTSFFFQQVHFMETKGLPLTALAALFPLFTVVSICFMLISGVLIDRFGSPRLMPIYQLPLALAFVVFANATTVWGIAVGMALFGITSGFNATLQSALWAEFFGTKHLGSIKAMAVALMVLGSAIGPGLTGWLIDQGITFPDQMLYIAAYFVLTSILAGIAVRAVYARLPEAPRAS
jgi:MFS family permease